MYCVHCGVKLSDTEKRCPLCQTVVFHPELEQPAAERLYPAAEPAEHKDLKILSVFLTLLFLLPLLLVLVCDWQINDRITWSGYVVGALVLGYVIFVLPTWFRKPNPVIFTPCGFAVLAAYLFYINWYLGGVWFWTFALPTTAGVCLIVTAVVTLMRYLPQGGLYIFGGASILLGAMVVVTELLVTVTFRLPKFLGWSFYPLVVLCLLGGGLIYLAICRPAREMMERKFFI